MINILNFYEAGKSRSGKVLIPFFDNVIIDSWRFSTRHGNAKVKWGDGTETDYILNKNIDYTQGVVGNSMSHTYSTPYTGDVEVIFKKGLKDVYSVNVIDWSKRTNNGLNEQRNKINIQDFGIYIKKFSNLYSYVIDTYSYATPAAIPIIKGDLADIPASVERISIASLEVANASTGDVYFNFNSLGLNSKLKYFLFTGGFNSVLSNLKFTGNIANLPIGCSFFKAQKVTSNSSITYTAGKVWASSFDTLSIPLVLSHTELDNLLIDMNNSITTKIGDGIIAFGGWRSGTSDAAVASLVAKGFTVNVQKYSITPLKILDLDFQNNFTDTSSSALTMVAGGTSNQPTFALSGRKPGEYCAVFNGSQSIKTTTNLPVNSDKATVVFAIKTTQSTAAAIFELSPDWVSANAFVVDINNSKVSMAEQVNASTRNIRASSANINDNTWKHITVVFDRANPTATKITLYINGVLAGTAATTNGSTSGNFVNNIAFIGQRAGSSLGFNGSLMRLKAYNYPLTPAEITADYNAFL